MIIHVLDCETTGLDPEKDRVVEIADVPVCSALCVQGEKEEWLALEGRATLVNAQISIPPEATGVHHILDADVVGKPWLGNAITLVTGSKYGDDVEIIAAHNARFDRDFLPLLAPKKWIDTYRCALHVWPLAPNHKNGTLYYWLGLPRRDDLIAAGIGTHRALFDANMTAAILIKLLELRSVDELLKLSTKAVVLIKVGFGKYFGKLWTEVPKDYLQWATGQDFDPDVKFTVKYELKRRAGLPAS